ncbi:hypothetical protein QLS71_016195 [Mariniflexile litorale]|uniref:C1q domain-containing protein n=1 Tax=Mariniflexile litorale TaxID=3045158 RepID=A0AAU7EFN3_9FLAO|nr:hypothetical protein [Mariniflexile sp. KMM 9835]MDQ8212313.1 hypothetical protein [Mariniflexile sp. KMM 9835]
MKTVSTIVTVMLFTGQLFSQVGIINNAPQATLDITAKNVTGGSTNIDGLLVPRVDRQRAQSMTSVTTSTLIYVNSIVTGTQTGTAIDINQTGFYFFNGIKWVKLNNSTAATAGTVINTQMINITGANVTNSSTTYTTVATTNYTPVSNNSKIIIEFYTKYSIAGAGIDSFTSRLRVAGTVISTGEQMFRDNNGAGTRSATLFPLMGSYTNTATTVLTIEAQLARVSSNDNTTVTRDNGTWFKITEVAN